MQFGKVRHAAEIAAQGVAHLVGEPARLGPALVRQHHHEFVTAEADDLGGGGRQHGAGALDQRGQDAVAAPWPC